MGYLWVGSTSTAIPPTFGSDIMSQHNRIGSIIRYWWEGSTSTTILPTSMVQFNKKKLDITFRVNLKILLDLPCF